MTKLELYELENDLEQLKVEIDETEDPAAEKWKEEVEAVMETITMIRLNKE